MILKSGNIIAHYSQKTAKTEKIIIERMIQMLSNKAYDILKWITLVALPALGTAYVALANVWGLPYPEEVSKTVLAVCTLLGALLGVSTAEYNKK